MISRDLRVNIQQGLPVSDFESILDQFQNWKEFKREINLTTLLEGDKVEYKLENIRGNQKAIVGLLEGSTSDIIELRKIAFLIRELTFKIESMRVISLLVKIETLETEYGKTIDSIIESGIDFTLNIQKSISGKILYFYPEFQKVSV